MDRRQFFASAMLALPSPAAASMLPQPKRQGGEFTGWELNALSWGMITRQGHRIDETGSLVLDDLRWGLIRYMDPCREDCAVVSRLPARHGLDLRWLDLKLEQEERDFAWPHDWASFQKTLQCFWRNRLPEMGRFFTRYRDFAESFRSEQE